MRALLLGVLLFFSTGCTKAELLDFAMHSAPHAPSGPKRVGDYELLAGDLHTHVLPPDAPWHVTRGLPSTARLAKAEGLDFVVLTPHVSSRFYMLPLERDWVLRTQAELRAGVDALPEKDVLFVPGMEYTDYRYGHVGLGFANVAEVLNEVTTADPPERFFQRWTAHGGLMVINHPVLRGIPRAPFLELRYDLGWRALFDPPPPVPPEVAWITEHATGIETLNTSISHLRDQFIIGDAERTLREGAHLADRVARTQHRRLTPVGGSDSHGEWMRATTWVLARDRTIAGVREAIVRGRTCVRGPAACSFTARVVGERAAHVGGALASGAARSIEVSADGTSAGYYVNGALVAEGRRATIRVPGTCVLLRAIVDESWSAPIYVDCPWANEAEAVRP
jgi:hypothetical protein